MIISIKYLMIVVGVQLPVLYCHIGRLWMLDYQNVTLLMDTRSMS